MGVNNEIYATLGERWYTAQDDPIALLRAESRLRNPWVAERIEERFGKTARVLDIGCGAGFLSNALSRRGHEVVGVDAAGQALQIAERFDETDSALYVTADARKLPFDDESFDSVCAMDVLEHIHPWENVVSEAARVLRPKGVFLFYTFNRTWLSWLFAIKGLEWLVRNTPPDLHVYSYFIRPEELLEFSKQVGLAPLTLQGVRPRFSKAFFRLLMTGFVPEDLEFCFTRGTQMAYLGGCLKS